MKIAIVSSYFYPWYGGITEHVFFMYRELKSRGYTVKIITPFDGKDVLDDRNDLIQIGRPISFLFNGSVVKIPFIFKRKNTINRILAEEQFDIVHLHQPLFCVLGLTFLSCIKERKLRGIKTPRVVGTFHACGGGTERFLMKRLGFYFRKFCDDFDLRIAVSSASRDFVLPIMSGNFEIIPNGVDVARFGQETEKITRFDDGIMNLLFVGRLEPRKGLTTLLQSLSIVKDFTNMPFRLLVVGNGFMTDYYKSRVPRDVLDKVFFIGEVSFKDIPRYYKTAHIFCSPATYGESFGIVLIEAMAAGLPVIAGDNEGYRKVVKHGVNGMLINPVDPIDIASTIGMLLENGKMRRYLSLQGVLEAQKYSWSVVMSTIENYYLSFSGVQPTV